MPMERVHLIRLNLKVHPFSSRVKDSKIYLYNNMLFFKYTDMSNIELIYDYDGEQLSKIHSVVKTHAQALIDADFNYDSLNLTIYPHGYVPIAMTMIPRNTNNNHIQNQPPPPLHENNYDDGGPPPLMEDMPQLNVGHHGPLQPLYVGYHEQHPPLHVVKPLYVGHHGPLPPLHVVEPPLPPPMWSHDNVIYNNVQPPPLEDFQQLRWPPLHIIKDSHDMPPLYNIKDSHDMPPPLDTNFFNHEPPPPLQTDDTVINQNFKRKYDTRSSRSGVRRYYKTTTAGIPWVRLDSSIFNKRS